MHCTGYRLAQSGWDLCGIVGLDNTPFEVRVQGIVTKTQGLGRRLYI